MGFICVVRNEETDVAKLRGWGRWMKVYAKDAGDKTPEKLVNGTQVIVHPNTVAVQTREGAFVDIIITPGGYLYHENAPVNEQLEEYAAYMQGLVGLFIQDGAMEATGLAFIETDRQLSSPEELRGWFMQFAQPEPELTPAPEPVPVVTPVSSVMEQPVVQQPTMSTMPHTSQNESWECSACGTRNQFSFCKNCGKAKPESNTKKTKVAVNACPGCGKDLRNYTKIKFCPSCGKAL